MTDSTRRLPIYLVLDCSESMAGQAIDEVSRGVGAMLDALRSDPLAIETAWISVIAFSSYAKQLSPLTEVLSFQPPKLTIRTGTALGSALDLLLKCLQRDVVKTTATTKGDYKPIVILLTDGEPTDDWQPAAQRIKAQRKPGVANIYAIACGPDADTNILHELTDIVLRTKDMSRETWRKLFVWLTASVQTTSRALEGGTEGQSLNLPALPQDALELAPVSHEPRDPRPRQVFLHAHCSRSGKRYLMRYLREPHQDFYTAVCAHQLEGAEEEGSGHAPAISSSVLNGVAPCPYCENPGAGACGCGAILCCSPTDTSMVCPCCHEQVMMGYSAGDFDIRQVEG